MDPLPLRVCVPASTSNLGPGFDLIGVALSLDLTVEAVPAEGDGRWLELADEAADWPREDNLLARAFDMARGDRGGDYAFRVTSEIPLARGLGSSGAAVAAGLLLGRAAARGTESREQLLALGLELEGHPDNVAPALFGGARACVPRRDGARMVQLELHPEIGWSVAWPEVRIATEVARAALPREVPFADAVENPRRLALLLEGLRSADPGLLRDGIADRLHVAHRLALIPGAGRVLEAAYDAGAWAATLSGSGSAHVALGPVESADAVAGAMAEAWREVTGDGHGRVVRVVTRAPRVR